MVAVQKYLHLTLCFELQSQHLCFLPKPCECLTLRHICPGINPYFRGGNTVGVVIANSKLHLAPWFTLQSQHYVLPQKRRLSPCLPQIVLIVTVVLNCDNFKENLLLAPIFFWIIMRGAVHQLIFMTECFVFLLSLVLTLHEKGGRSKLHCFYGRPIYTLVEPCIEITWEEKSLCINLSLWQDVLYFCWALSWHHTKKGGA